MNIHDIIDQSYRQLSEKKILRVNATQIKDWNECRQKHRFQFVDQKVSVAWNIHYAFGSVIHKIAQCYWDNIPYLEAAHQAITLANSFDVRKIKDKDREKWSKLEEAIMPIATIYYGYHGTKNVDQPVLMNEKTFSWEWGSYAGFRVVCDGIIDRFTRASHLVDTKTASAVGSDWKVDLKKRLLREPQMGFYYRYKQEEGTTVEGIEYEIIVKPYRGSDPKIETIDVTREVMRFQPTFNQQMDWTIREMCEFYSKCTDASPWPMSNTACQTQWGECDYRPICLGNDDIRDARLYQIKTPHEVIV